MSKTEVLAPLIDVTEEISATQMVVTFTLKPGLLWSDGYPLIAADSAWAA